MPSEQWFVRMKDLAKPAIDAVREGKTQFIPKRFSKIYFNWMENIRDWCISRQLWWGHQIPAWTCSDCGELIVSEETPEVCPKCGGHHLKQEEDVLDTWFSSALWPFSTLGWPDDTVDLEKYYPNNVLVTGYDIIFFWVARMIFMGIDTMGEPPFSDVYIHGLIRDAQGRKMSKSLGNGIDPLEVIRDYSADAMRFAILTGNSAGNDIRWTQDKIESSRNFLNKIWNAARFVLMYMDSDIGLDLSKVSLESSDQWILSRMNQIIREVTANIDKYELGIAAQKVYDFAWNEFCDWYIEFVKPRLNGDDQGSRRAALTVLNVVLQNILKLLHPFIPFITEEIYHYLPGADEALIIASWPEADQAYDFPEEEAQIHYLMGIIRALRKIRKESNIPNKKKAALFVTTENQKDVNVLSNALDTLNKMAGVESIKKIEKDEIREDFVAAVVEDSTIYLALNDLVDKTKELERLNREKEKIEKDLKKTSGKLNNEKFLANAPEAVVEKERQKDQENQEKLAQVVARINALNA